MLGDNVQISAEELEQIRNLPDFDLEMIISEINDHGWAKARRTLAMAVEYLESAKGKQGRQP